MTEAMMEEGLKLIKLYRELQIEKLRLSHARILKCVEVLAPNNANKPTGEEYGFYYKPVGSESPKVNGYEARCMMSDNTEKLILVMMRADVQEQLNDIAKQLKAMNVDLPT